MLTETRERTRDAEASYGETRIADRNARPDRRTADRYGELCRRSEFECLELRDRYDHAHFGARVPYAEIERERRARGESFYVPTSQTRHAAEYRDLEREYARDEIVDREEERERLLERLSYKSMRAEDTVRSERDFRGFYTNEDMYDDNAETPPFRLSDTPRFDRSYEAYDAPTKNIKRSKFSLKGRLSKRGAIILAVYLVVAIVIVSLIIANAAGINSRSSEVAADTLSTNDAVERGAEVISSPYDYEETSNWFDKLCDGISGFFGGK